MSTTHPTTSATGLTVRTRGILGGEGGRETLECLG